jgi:hypothetical protein
MYFSHLAVEQKSRKQQKTMAPYSKLPSKFYLGCAVSVASDAIVHWTYFRGEEEASVHDQLAAASRRSPPTPERHWLNLQNCRNWDVLPI